MGGTGRRRAPFNGWDWFAPRAVEILGKHYTLADACREMSEELNHSVKRGSLREALRYRGYNSPGAYLKHNQVSLCKMEDGRSERDALPAAAFETPTPTSPVPVAPPPVVEEDPEEFEKWRTVDVDRFELMYREPIPVEGEQRTLVISDTHCQWTDYEALHICLNSEFAQQADRVILAGDLVDNEQFSKHERRTDLPMRISFEEMCDKVVVPCLSLPKVKELRVIAGNHDNWTKRYRNRYIIPDAYFMIKDQAGNDLFEVLGHIKLRVPDDRLHYRFGAENWYTEMGDAIVAHPTKFLGPTAQGKPGRTVWDRFNWFWKRKPWIRCLAIGHTHRFYEEKCCPAKYGSQPMMLMETCSMQNAEGAEYSLTGKSNYDPFHVGWAEIVQVDGVTDINRSRAVLLKVVG